MTIHLPSCVHTCSSDSWYCSRSMPWRSTSSSTSSSCCRRISAARSHTKGFHQFRAVNSCMRQSFSVWRWLMCDCSCSSTKRRMLPVRASEMKMLRKKEKGAGRSVW